MLLITYILSDNRWCFVEDQIFFDTFDESKDINIRRCTAIVFRAALGYYYTGIVECPADVELKELYRACYYLRIPFNLKAHKTFNMYLETEIINKIAAASAGQRYYCDIIILEDYEKIRRNREHPPLYGEETYSVIRSSKMCRFLEGERNRVIAKNVLQYRKLKNVRVRMESYPSHVEMIKTGEGTAEYVRKYIRRPFIHFS